MTKQRYKLLFFKISCKSENCIQDFTYLQESASARNAIPTVIEFFHLHDATKTNKKK